LLRRSDGGTDCARLRAARVARRGARRTRRLARHAIGRGSRARRKPRARAPGAHGMTADQPAAVLPGATVAGRVLITGGAGFIGTNLAGRLAGSGRHVVVLDTLSRAGVERNARWLRRTHGDRVEIIVGDVRDRAAVEHALSDVSEVYHLAAQVAVTTSLDDPLHDFDVNARGTLTLLEALRRRRPFPTLLFTS